MNFQDYKNKALLTESKPTELNFGEVGLHMLLSAAIQMGEVLNLAKRTIFYGKEFDSEKVRKLGEDIAGYGQLIYQLSDHLAMKNDRENFETVPEQANTVDAKNVDLRLLHSAIGIYTEAAEALELVRDQLEGKPFDTVGWGEEIGDLSWYEALGCDAAGVDRDQILQANITKLEKRNKGQKFNAEATINRDAEAERAQLEADLSK